MPSSNYDEKRINELKEMLRGLKWREFVPINDENPKDYQQYKIINGVRFFARAGTILGQRTFIAIMAEGKFIHLHKVTYPAAVGSQVYEVLDPNNEESGVGTHVSLPWSGADRFALREKYIIGPPFFNPKTLKKRVAHAL